MEPCGVIFDVDDTMYDQLKPFDDTLSRFFGPDHSVDGEALFRRTRHHSDTLWNDYAAGSIRLEEVRRLRIIHACRDFGLDLAEEEADRFQAEYEQAQRRIAPFEEVPRLLGDLRRNGYLVGIITNGPVKHQRDKIDRLGLSRFVEERHILVSDELDFAKPDSRIFDVYRARVGLPAERLIYVGDNWVNDIAPSIEAGWRAIWFNHRRKAPESNHKPLAEIDSIDRIREYL
ncbi:Haloacetate dehalogenase H-2 [Paenibacillus sp. CECT 9249]|uniref:HAD family hydrolase n=1 Tax=Paenibacillus sp. CECT 9249 TaxID=2845385 RepID=UPI001E63D736|nr:HAD family hydrolase [Paenibacillus sp. CECT 9249]CAH0122213.1 Haloacetate dehalogenase H-2 [Paenibacillus sp. CECT 9249]